MKSLKTGEIVALGLIVLILAATVVYFVNQNRTANKTLSSIQQQPMDTSLPSQNSDQNSNQSSAAGNSGTQAQASDGRVAKAGDTVAVNYVGTLENGTKFDSSYDRGQPIQFTLGVGQVIKGWDEGIAGMKVGEKKHLVIPGDKAYGAQGVQSEPGKYVIPPNATLIFDVELVGIK